MKKIIKLNETELKRLIKEAIKGMKSEQQQYVVYLRPFAGDKLIPFVVSATDDEQALERAVAQAEKVCPSVLRSSSAMVPHLTDDDIDDEYIYVDATSEGASQPYYIDAYSTKIEPKKNDNVNESRNHRVNAITESVICRLRNRL